MAERQSACQHGLRDLYRSKIPGVASWDRPVPSRLNVAIQESNSPNPGCESDFERIVLFSTTYTVLFSTACISYQQNHFHTWTAANSQAWAFANLNRQPPGKLLDLIAEASEAKMESFSAQNISNLLWCLPSVALCAYVRAPINLLSLTKPSRSYGPGQSRVQCCSAGWYNLITSQNW
jgi:hypothetical protein